MQEPRSDVPRSTGTSQQQHDGMERGAESSVPGSPGIPAASVPADVRLPRSPTDATPSHVPSTTSSSTGAVTITRDTVYLAHRHAPPLSSVATLPPHGAPVRAGVSIPVCIPSTGRMGATATRYVRSPAPAPPVCISCTVVSRAAAEGGGPAGMPVMAVSTPHAVLMTRPPPPSPSSAVFYQRSPPPQPPGTFPHPPGYHHYIHPITRHPPPPPPLPPHLQPRFDRQQRPLMYFDGDDDDDGSYSAGALQMGGRRPYNTLRISKWVNPIPFDPDDGQQQVGEQELATKMLQIQSKRFYIDVKQNRRGRFMKVAEIGADGRRNQVFLALSTAAEFREHLTQFSDFYSNLGPPNPDTLPEDGKLKSETMVKDNRRYYLDLKENSRGRFLRVSQTIARGGPRCQIAIPAQGMIEFRDALQELLDEFGTDDGGFKGELPEGRHMRVENKNFYFDIGQNNRGIYMRISEVKTNFRTAITIPEKSWSRFRDIFSDYVDKMKEGGVDKEKAPPSGESTSSSPTK